MLAPSIHYRASTNYYFACNFILYVLIWSFLSACLLLISGCLDTGLSLQVALKVQNVILGVENGLDLHIKVIFLLI